MNNNSNNHYHYYKTDHSIFTVDEIDAFCNEWGWLHVKEFVKNPNWNDHKPPYIWGCAGIGEFFGIDGNKYMTHNTFRSNWIGDVKNDPINKLEFKEHLKHIAGDYYGKNREHYYFYDVFLTGGGPFDCHELEKYGCKPNVYALESHGKPFYNITLSHMGVTNGKMWGYHKKS